MRITKEGVGSMDAKTNNTSADVSEAQKLTQLTWSGHCLIATMQILKDHCFQYPEKEGEELREIIKQIDSYSGAYHALRLEKNSAVMTILFYAGILLLNVSKIIDCAVTLSKLSVDRGGVRGESLRYSLCHDLGVFQRQTKQQDVAILKEYIRKQIGAKIYDIEFLRLVRETDLKIISWYLE